MKIRQLKCAALLTFSLLTTGCNRIDEFDIGSCVTPKDELGAPVYQAYNQGGY